MAPYKYVNLTDSDAHQSNNEGTQTVKISDIDFYEDFVIVTGKGSKQRIVPIGTDLKSNLLKYLKVRDEYINKNPKEILSICYVLQKNLLIVHHLQSIVLIKKLQEY